MSFAVQVLGYLGRLAEAASSDVNDGLPSFGDLPVLMESVLLGAGSAERVERALRSFRSTPNDGLGGPMWCGGVGLGRTPVACGGSWHAQGAAVETPSYIHPTGSTRSAYLALARHDTTGALRAFAKIIDSDGSDFTVDLLQRARLLVATGKLDEARRQYTLAVGGDGPLSVVARLELAELAERQGAREQALESYQFVAAIWKHADSVLQPYVARARAGLARLTSESRPSS